MGIQSTATFMIAHLLKLSVGVTCHPWSPPSCPAFSERAGRAILFHNCEEDGAVGGKADGVDEASMDDEDEDDVYYMADSKQQLDMRSCPRPHPSTRHAGLPVERGEKWALNLWVREWETKRSGKVYRAHWRKHLAGRG